MEHPQPALLPVVGGMNLRQRNLLKLLGLSAVSAAISLTPLSDALAQDSPRGRLSLPNSQTLHYAPLKLNGGSNLTLISPAEWSPLAERLGRILDQTQRRYAELLGQLPQLELTLHLMAEDDFFSTTGAPSWTNALYYRGQIIIPLSENAIKDSDNLYRSVRHEYTHALVAALSNGRCPGWLDEGLAQWAEGSENPVLRRALYKYIRENPPLPLSILQGGFTKLNTGIVAPAYAQSLIASYALVEAFGYGSLRRYFDELRVGTDKDEAFAKAFRITSYAFEANLQNKLLAWRDGTSQLPAQSAG